MFCGVICVFDTPTLLLSTTSIGVSSLTMVLRLGSVNCGMLIVVGADVEETTTVDDGAATGLFNTPGITVLVIPLTS